MKFDQFMSYILQKKKTYEKNLQKLRPGNYFQSFLCLHRIKHNLYWKIKLLKQPTYVRYALGKLTKFVQISAKMS